MYGCNYQKWPPGEKDENPAGIQPIDPMKSSSFQPHNCSEIDFLCSHFTKQPTTRVSYHTLVSSVSHV